MPADAARKDTPLAKRLKRQLAGGGEITFADFMRECLLDPEHGYYAKGPEIGPEGDFVTAPAFPGFAEALADQIVEMRARLGEPENFRVVEVGAGTGELALSVCEALDARGVKDGYAYELVEPAAGLREMQAERTGLDVHAGVAEAGPVTGVILANEVLDALPFHRVVQTEEGLRELFVVVEDGELAERPMPLSTPAIQEQLEAVGATLQTGQVVEVNLLTGPFLRALAGRLDRGYVLFFDYGDEADVLYGSPSERGTLRTYREHQVETDPFEAPGAQDLTADVDFTAVRAAAEAAGLDAVGYVSQGRFLLNLGIAERTVDLMEARPEDAYRMKSLFLPGGMGERFKAACFARDAPLDLKGFQGPLTF